MEEHEKKLMYFLGSVFCFFIALGFILLIFSEFGAFDKPQQQLEEIQELNVIKNDTIIIKGNYKIYIEKL